MHLRLFMHVVRLTSRKVENQNHPPRPPTVWTLRTETNYPLCSLASIWIGLCCSIDFISMVLLFQKDSSTETLISFSVGRTLSFSESLLKMLHLAVPTNPGLLYHDPHSVLIRPNPLKALNLEFSKNSNLAISHPRHKVVQNWGSLLSYQAVNSGLS